MKKSITLLGFSVLIVTAMVITPANAQQDKNNNKKEQAQKQQKKQDKPDKADKVNQGKKDDKDDQSKSDQKNNQGNKDGKDNNGNNDDKSVGNNDKNDGFQWDRSNFKNREKIKNKEKVTLCHKFNSNDEPAVTIKVSSHALKAHLNHGDIQGDCPTVASKSFSDNFIRKRTDYFNTVQTNHEQVSYSRSVLDYAVARLTSSRQQLATMQRNKMPVADIERKQAKVVELEQNVSLLETLISAAANLVVNKLQ